MAIANGDTVIVYTPAPSGIQVLPAPPVHGIASSVGGGTARVDWTNGLSTASVPLTILRKVLTAGGPFLIGRPYRVLNVQEMIGVLSDIYIAEDDAATGQVGIAILALTGRGEAPPTAYALVELDPTFLNFTALFAQQVNAKFPRY
jgi:hypothetical protein